jgi:hypothetical protein
MAINLDTLGKSFAPLLLLAGGLSSQGIAQVYSEHTDWACLILPFDAKPDNRINILGSLGYASIAHVKSNAKEAYSSNNKKITKIELINKTRVFDIDAYGKFIILFNYDWGYLVDADSGDKMTINDGWRPAQAYLDGASGGVTYQCKPVKLVPIENS